MTKPDWADEKAAELLPCYCTAIEGQMPAYHLEFCPMYYRPAVAAALRKKQAEIERLKAENAKLRAVVRFVKDLKLDYNVRQFWELGLVIKQAGGDDEKPMEYLPSR